MDSFDPLVAMHGDELIGYGSTFKGRFPTTGKPMFVGNPNIGADAHFSPIIVDTFRKYNNATYGYDDEYGFAPAWWTAPTPADLADWTPARVELCSFERVNCDHGNHYISIFDIVNDGA
jgi:hypothetical protein